MAEPLWDFTLWNTYIENVITVLQDIWEMIIKLDKVLCDGNIVMSPINMFDQENFTHNKKDTTKGSIAVTETTSLSRRR